MLAIAPRCENAVAVGGTSATAPLAL
jgi:hypothetical protein